MGLPLSPIPRAPRKEKEERRKRKESAPGKIQKKKGAFSRGVRPPDKKGWRDGDLAVKSLRLA